MGHHAKQWFERGVKEAIWERVEAPSLNRKGGLRFRLSHSWDTVLHVVPSCISACTNDRALRSLVVLGETSLSFRLMSSTSFVYLSKPRIHHSRVRFTHIGLVPISVRKVYS